MVHMPDMALLYTLKNFSSVIYTQTHSDLLTFSLPLKLKDAFHFNGKSLHTNEFCINGACLDVGRGGPREVVSGALQRDRVVADIAALQGVDPDDCILPTGRLHLPALAVRRLAARLLHILHHLSTDAGILQDPRTMAEFSRQAYDVILDYMLCAQQRMAPQYPRRRCPSHIVQAAEQRFEAANGDTLSLADLCKAAKVSAGTLTAAFRSQTDMTPARYFKLRRICQAHDLLESGTFDRSPVKQAALSVGLTELGRFSIEYKALFGRSPSQTRAQP